MGDEEDYTDCSEEEITIIKILKGDHRFSKDRAMELVHLKRKYHYEHGKGFKKALQRTMNKNIVFEKITKKGLKYYLNSKRAFVVLRIHGYNVPEGKRRL